MTTDDDEAARRARAEGLRKRIGGLTGGGAAAPAPTPVTPSKDESPGEFVNRRMRELDKPAAKQSAKRPPKPVKPR
jgi:hypothetical protein